MRKIDSHTFQGMQRDMSVSKQQPQFLWEAHNIRLTAREGDTLLSITNEKGTKEAQITGDFDGARIAGNYVGHCVIRDYLVLFTHAIEGDYIYRLHKETGKTFTMTCLTGVEYSESTGKINGYVPLQLGFDLSHPLQTLGVYENQYIQKVYWTDGINQPRVINITKDILSGRPTYTNDSFDFVPRMQLKDSVQIRRIADSSGTFSAGVIQYAVSYFNKYGQQSNISCVSSLIGTSYTNRAGSPEEKIGNSFEVTVHNPDTGFEYMRVYSIFRSSLNATPLCKRVIDIKIGDAYSESSKGLVTSNPTSQTSIGMELGFQVKETYTGDWKTQDDYENLVQNTGIPSAKVSGEFYVFHKEDYPELVIRALARTSASTVGTKYITWGDTDILYVPKERIYINQQLSSVAIAYGVKNSVAASFIAADYIGYNEKSDTGIKFTDNGTIGEDIDSQELLYIGGESITAETLESKDGTLFFGNVKVQRPKITQDLKEQLAQNATGRNSSQDWSDCRYAVMQPCLNSPNYKWENSLNARIPSSGMYSEDSYDSNGSNISTAGFKSREHYRLGVQFQYKTGKWSEPVFLADKIEGNKPKIEDKGFYSTLRIPTFSAVIDADSCTQLINSGYVRARGLVVLPSAQDRLVIAQGMMTPSVYGIALRNNNSPDFQSSWFFRPWPASSSDTDIYNEGRTNVYSGASVEYRHNYSLYGFNNRGAEIQGVPKRWGGKEYKQGGKPLPYQNSTVTLNIGLLLGEDDDRTVGTDQCGNIFCVDQQNVTMHSPDFEFSTSFASLDLSTILARKVGSVGFTANTGDIDLQTSTPVIGETSTGFYHKALSVTTPRLSDKRLCAGLFYWDYVVDENSKGVIQAYDLEDYEFAFMVYPWQKTGSLNNDCNRPSGNGTRSAVLSRKIISNLKYSQDTEYDENVSGIPLKGQANKANNGNAIQLFDSDQVSIVKTAGLNYYGNVDMLLTPPVPYGAVFSTGGSTSLQQFSPNSDKTSYTYTSKQCSFDDPSEDFWAINKSGAARLICNSKTLNTGTIMDPSWALDGTLEEDLGDKNGTLRISRETIRMKYKSTPHAVLSLQNPLEQPSANTVPVLYMGELYREAQADTDFGGITDEAKQSNLWIPAGDAVTLSSEGTQIHYDYGDTWYQRYDCLKTYAFTEEDTNSVVEIGSFMTESHVNIDGRYDRNRGQNSNLAMSPQNFNLINDVYSQTDNFFNYRILDSDYYDQNYYSSMVTWSTVKNNASEVDPWTAVTLASTLELDGTKGIITDIVGDKDMLYAFQERGIAQVLFNSRVAINTSDNVPIEISNNYKVDGYRYISSSVGCNSKFMTAKSPMGVYFIDSIGRVLYLLDNGQLADISDTHGFSYWFSQQDTGSKWQVGRWDNEMTDMQGTALYYDLNKKDLYITTCDSSLCYSELLGQFVSFLDYQGGVLFNIGDSFHAVTNYGDARTDLWNMFEGAYNSCFYDKRQSYITFISNSENTADKIFSNLEIRGDFYNESNELQHQRFFDSIQVWNEYQDTGETALIYKAYPYSGSAVGSNTKKKFRIWRCNIPREWKNGKRSLNRIRNTWCKIKLAMNTDSNAEPLHMEIHDINVIYYT